MKPSELISYWDTPDNSKLTAKQFSIRLPIHVSAKIQALCDMYPAKTRTQIIGDLLSSVLADIEKSFPFVEGEYMGHDPDTNEPIVEDIGPRYTFTSLTQKYIAELEAELDESSKGES